MRYHLIDEGAFDAADLAGRDGLPALLFRLENASDPGAMMAPLGPGVRVPEELLEVRTMLATKGEKWKQQWLAEGELKGRQLGELLGEQRGEKRGEQRGRRLGEAALLLRQLERRFGALPDWARDRVLAADTDMIETWGLRVLNCATLEEVFASGLPSPSPLT